MWFPFFFGRRRRRWELRGTSLIWAGCIPPAKPHSPEDGKRSSPSITYEMYYIVLQKALQVESMHVGVGKMAWKCSPVSDNCSGQSCENVPELILVKTPLTTTLYYLMMLMILWCPFAWIWFSEGWWRRKNRMQWQWDRGRSRAFILITINVILNISLK